MLMIIYVYNTSDFNLTNHENRATIKHNLVFMGLISVVLAAHTHMKNSLTIKVIPDNYADDGQVYGSNKALGELLD